MLADARPYGRLAIAGDAVTAGCWTGAVLLPTAALTLLNRYFLAYLDLRILPPSTRRC